MGCLLLGSILERFGGHLGLQGIKSFRKIPHTKPARGGAMPLKVFLAMCQEDAVKLLVDCEGAVILKRETEGALNTVPFPGVAVRPGLGYALRARKLTWQASKKCGRGSGGNPPGDANVFLGTILIKFTTRELGAEWFEEDCVGAPRFTACVAAALPLARDGGGVRNHEYDVSAVLALREVAHLVPVLAALRAERGGGRGA